MAIECYVKDYCVNVGIRNLKVYSVECYRNVNPIKLKKKRISSVMVRVLVSSAVDRGFAPRSHQAIDYKIRYFWLLR